MQKRSRFDHLLAFLFPPNSLFSALGARFLPPQQAFATPPQVSEPEVIDLLKTYRSKNQAGTLVPGASP